MKSIRKRIMSNSMMTNSAYSLAAKALTMVFFFVLDILCARMLDANAYGEWVYFYAIITIVYSIVWFGVNISSKISIAKTEASRQMEVFVSALALRFFVSIILTFAYIAVMMVLLRLQFFDLQKYPQLTSLLLIGGVLVFLNSFSEFFKEVFVGFVDFRGLFIVNFCEYAGYFVFGVLGLILRRDVIGIIWGFVLSLIVTVTIGFGIVIRTYHLLEVKVHRQNVVLESKKIFQYAKYIALSGIGTILLTEIDTFMIGYFREGYDTAVYSIAKQLSSKAIHVNLALSTSMMPVFANITIENAKAKKMQFKKVMLCNLAVTTGITVCFLIFGKAVIQLLYGEKYLFAVDVLYCLLPYYVISSFSKFLVLFLDYQNKAKIRSIVFSLTVLFDIVLNRLLIPKFGAVGASIATDIALLPYLVFLFVESAIIFSEYQKIGGKK